MDTEWMNVISHRPHLLLVSYHALSLSYRDLSLSTDIFDYVSETVWSSIHVEYF
jgi:hypothetical protein